jgi:hypothetical protein
VILTREQVLSRVGKHRDGSTGAAASRELKAFVSAVRADRRELKAFVSAVRADLRRYKDFAVKLKRQLNIGRPRQQSLLDPLLFSVGTT